MGLTQIEFLAVKCDGDDFLMWMWICCNKKKHAMGLFGGMLILVMIPYYQINNQIVDSN